MNENSELHDGLKRGKQLSMFDWPGELENSRLLKVSRSASETPGKDCKTRES